MDNYLKIPINLFLMASGAAMWFLTPWSVWSAAMVMAGLGVLTLGSYVSFAFIGATVLLLLLGYTVQPEVVSIVEMLPL
jgi:hypothetical protein